MNQKIRECEMYITRQKKRLFVRRSAGNKDEHGSTADSLQYEQGQSVLEPEAASHALRPPEELHPLSNSTITAPI